MNVSLTPELEALVQKKVQSGMYHSASEVVRDSLRLLDAHDRLREIQVEQLRAEVQIGIEQIDNGQYRTYKVGELEKLFDDIKRDGRAMMERAGKVNV